jgi:hypothetical protein
MAGKAGHGHNAHLYTSGLALAASGTSSFILSTKNITRLNLFMLVDYLLTDAVASGVTVTQRYGMRSIGNASTSNTLPWTDPSTGEVVNVLVAGNSDAISSIVATPLGEVAPIQVISEWNVGLDVLPEFLILDLENTDTVNDTVLTLIGDEN